MTDEAARANMLYSDSDDPGSPVELLMPTQGNIAVFGTTLEDSVGNLIPTITEILTYNDFQSGSSPMHQMPSMQEDSNDQAINNK